MVRAMTTARRVNTTRTMVTIRHITLALVPPLPPALVFSGTGSSLSNEANGFIILYACVSIRNMI